MSINQSVSFAQFQSTVNSAIAQSGMTFNPSTDCRNDLVNFYGYTREQVNNMSDEELFSIMDRIEREEDGGFDETALPTHIQDNKCSCGGKLKVVYVDCETRGDCEIYNCECVKCGSPTSFNYAEEWYDEDFYNEEEQQEFTINIETEATKKEIVDNRLLSDVQNLLSIRSYHCLKRAGYETVQQVKNASLDDMMKVRNMGIKSLEEIQTVFNIKFI